MANTKKPVKHKSLADLQNVPNKNSPAILTVIPFRSDNLNLFLGGGIYFGHVNEISGDPGFYKSTILAELIGAALAIGAYIIIHDKEGKLTAARFTSLNIHGVNKDNPKVWIKVDAPPYVITLEGMFTEVHEIYAAIREHDLEQLQAKFAAGKADKALCDRYGHLNEKAYPAVGKGKKSDKAFIKRCGTWQKVIAKNLFSPAQVDVEDKSPILWAVDSVTSTPNKDEALDPVSGQPNLKPTMAKSARVWSDLLRTCGFRDEKMAIVHIAQIRTAGIGSARTYKKAAVPMANAFYATNRLKVFPASKGALYRDPLEPSKILIAKSELSSDQKAFQIGRIIMVSIDKSLSGIQTSIPLYMLNATGTDVINSMFEFLAVRKLIKAAGPYYKFTEAFWKERSETSFNRLGFTDIYINEGVELLSKLQAYKELIVHGK